ncbi:MAG: CsgG/HfaB family protein [Paludibacter sp.]
MNQSRIKTIRLFIYVLSILVITACASQRYAKLALKNEQAGLFEDAAELYLKSLNADKENIDAKIGVKKNGQLTLDDKLGKFTKAYVAGDSKNAVYLYLAAKEYLQRLSTNGIRLDFPNTYEEQYNDVKNILVEERYKQGVKLMNEENFVECEPIFKEILTLENGYKDVKELWKTAHYEPLYRQGKAYLDNRQFRKSYYTFNTIIVETGGYKEAVQLKQDAINAAIYPITIKPFENINSEPAFGYKLRSSVISALTKSENPFLKVIDKANRDEMLNEQKLGLSGITNQNSSAQAGKLLGEKAILTGKVMYLNGSQGNLVRSEARAFFKQAKTIIVNGQNVIDYDYLKIKYYVYSQTNSVSCVFKYQLTSTETGSILISDEIPLTKSDAIQYAYYNGDYRNLVPGTWKYDYVNSAEDKIYTDLISIIAFHTTFNANRNIKSLDNLVNELSIELTQRTATKILGFNPEN